MGLLNEIINNKMQRHTQQQAAQQQAQLQYEHDAMTNAATPEAAEYHRQNYQDLLTPDGKKRYQKALQLKNVFQNVIGTDEHGVLQGQPGQQPVGKGATLNSPIQQGMGGTPPADPNTPAPDASAGGENFGPYSGAKAQTTDLGQTSAPTAPTSAPPAGFPGLLASPLGDTAHSDASPTPPAPAAAPAPSLAQTPATPAPAAPYTPSAQDNFNTFSKYGQANVAQQQGLQRNRNLAEQVLGPGKEGTAAYQEILATGAPSTVITEKAKLEAAREVGQSILDDLEKQGIKVPDAMKAEILANKNLGFGAMLPSAV